MRSYFIFNDVHSAHWGILLREPAAVIRARERVTTFSVPGRAGALTLTEGERIFEPYPQRIRLSIPYDAVQAGVLDRLTGAGEVTFSTDPGKKQDCRVIEEVSLTKVSYHINWYEGAITFECQPYKKLIHEDENAVLSSGSVLTNLGDVTEKPVWKVDGSGDFTLTVGESEFSLTGMPEGGCIIDSGAEMVTSQDGAQLLTDISEGLFPALRKGANTVSWSGSSVTRVIACRRQRWI